MINSQLNHFAAFGGADMSFEDFKIDAINYSPTEIKPTKFSSKTNSTPGSNNSNNNNNNSNTDVKNGIVDAGKLLLEAAKTGDTDKVNDCIRNGAPFITDWLGTSALHIAAKNNFYETCATLLRAGISKDAKTKVDRTPLHFAVFEGNFQICQLLLQHECTVDPLDMLRMTPLHWAIDRNFDNIAEILLEAGANPHIVSKFLKTPYSIAKERNNDFIVKIIENLPTNLPPVKHRKPSFTAAPPPRSTPEAASTSRKREKSTSFDAMPEKRTKPSPLSNDDGKNLTLQMLKDQMAASMLTNSDDNLIQSVLQSGRKIMLSEAGKRLLNDSNLNKILKNPLQMTSKKSTPATVTSESSNNVLEIFRESSSTVAKPKPTDLLDILRTASSSDFQEVTITQCSKTSPSPSPTQKSSGLVLSPINVPKVKKSAMISTDANHVPDVDTSPQAEATQRQLSELATNYQQLKRQFEREQVKSAGLARQLKQLEMNFENYRRQQNEKFESLLKLLIGGGNGRRDMIDDVEEVF